MVWPGVVHLIKQSPETGANPIGGGLHYTHFTVVPNGSWSS
jgi:hypothetical protein